MQLPKLELTMPFATLYLVDENPLPSTQSSQDPRKSLRNFVIAIEPPKGHPDGEIWVYVTEFTSTTVLGLDAARDCGLTQSGTLRVWLICEFEGKADRFGPVDLEVTVSRKVPKDYFELGWDVLLEYFDVHTTEPDGDLRLKAKTPALCQ